jgi:hypothetical protein
MVKVGRSHWVRVEVDASEVDHPRELRRVIDNDLLGRPAGRKAQFHGVDPLGLGFGGSLLKEEVTLRAVNVPLERHWSPAGPPQRSLRDS